MHDELQYLKYDGAFLKVQSVMKQYDTDAVQLIVSILSIISVGNLLLSESLMIELSAFPVSILRKSISGRHRPVRVADGPMTARYRFM